MLEAKNISKSFNKVAAVNGVSFNVKRGEFYGLLGPNGAGKTTTINMISAILPPDAGNILIDGSEVYSNQHALKQKMGIVPQEIALYDELTALDNLLFWGSLYHVKKQDAKLRAAHLLEWVGLADRKNDLVKTYSGGMKRRVNIACALMHEPELIIMDEPTVGIDPQSRNKIFELITELHKEGKTILYTTHYMEEAERLCDRIGIIDKGTIIAEGSLNELKSTHSLQETVVITYLNESLPAVNFNNFQFQHNNVDKEITVIVNHVSRELPELIKLCVDQGVAINHVDIRSVNLETIFLHLTGRQLRD